MAKTTWGRKETIIWPRHMPVYTYGLAFAVVALTFIAVCYSNSPRHALAAVLPARLRTHYRRSAHSWRRHRSNYRMLFVSGRGAAPRPAMNGDVCLGQDAGAGR